MVWKLRCIHNLCEGTTGWWTGRTFLQISCTSTLLGGLGGTLDQFRVVLDPCHYQRRSVSSRCCLDVLDTDLSCFAGADWNQIRCRSVRLFCRTIQPELGKNILCLGWAHCHDFYYMATAICLGGCWWASCVYVQPLGCRNLYYIRSWRGQFAPRHVEGQDSLPGSESWKLSQPFLLFCRKLRIERSNPIHSNPIFQSMYIII